MSQDREIVISHPGLEYVLSGDHGLRLRRLALPSGASWAKEGSECGVFAVFADGDRIDGTADGLTVREVSESDLGDGARHATVRLRYEPGDLEIEHNTLVYPGTSLLETWLTVRNTGAKTVRIDRLDSICLDIPAGEHELMHYTSGWGQEFEGVREPLRGATALETRAGRSSQGQHPWFALFRGDGEILSASAMWSGNWIFRFEPLDGGGYRLSGGLHDWGFCKDLTPGESVESARAVVALGRGELNTVSTQYARVGRRHWYPTNELSRSLPVEWNHWWSYEDRDIDEAVFKRNVDASAELGMEVCTLDAGWFGPTDPGSEWYDYRGDWDRVNTARFPGGIRALSDYVHGKGLKFGLWCEIEGLGRRARLAESHPEFVALRSGERLGYVCFGNPAAREWGFATLDRLITEYGCDWIKLDFNLDPGAGCDRTDHGHGAGDGLYEHYRGYYEMLERIREKHPHVVLESCSSGGLRIDLGLLKRTHVTFLSDPDWPEHDLQLFWGASTMLAPEVCLHWGWCEWINEHPRQTFNPRDPNLKPYQLDYYTRISMLGAFGFSQKLPELPEWVADRFAYHIRMYREEIERFVRSADVHRLTEQPRREGKGDRWAGFQYAMPDGTEHLLFVFRLDGAGSERVLYPRSLEGGRTYALTWLSAQRSEQRRGAELMRDGVRFDDLLEEDSAIVLIK
jgi:alpha-galactosidase